MTRILHLFCCMPHSFAMMIAHKTFAQLCRGRFLYFLIALQAPAKPAQLCSIASACKEECTELTRHILLHWVAACSRGFPAG